MRAAVAAIVVAAAVLWCGLTFGSRTAGGADQYGYVSQAELWLKGGLRIRQEFVADMPWPYADETFAPLGYRPADMLTLVPTYPPGLPLLMAGFSLAAGSQGPYYVAPVCAALLVLLTYALGACVSGRAIGLAAALCLAASPTFLYMTMWPMSDVPVAAFWTASLLLAARGSAGGAIGAGLAAGIAVLIRPNIVPLAAVPMLIVLWRAADVPLRARIRRAAAFALACAPFALFIGWLFNDLYGSPLQSGYGDHKGLFSASFVPQNLATYPRWLLETQTPLILLFVASPFIAAAGSRFLRGALLAFVVLIAACYLFYLPFEAWWYLRFLLPAFPLMFILAADVVARVAARLGGQWKTAALASFATIMVAFGAYQAHQRFAFAIRAGEKKYEDVGKHVATTLPGNAVVYAMQHSGSIRYYSGRLTLRHDRLSPGWLDFSVEHLRKLGYEPFFVLDDWEVEDFLKKFPGQKYAALVEKEPPNAACTHTTYLYRVVEQWSTRVPQYSGCR